MLVRNCEQQQMPNMLETGVLANRAVFGETPTGHHDVGIYATGTDTCGCDYLPSAAKASLERPGRCPQRAGRDQRRYEAK
jgi:hypothetical protein